MDRLVGKADYPAAITYLLYQTYYDSFKPKSLFINNEIIPVIMK